MHVAGDFAVAETSNKSNANYGLGLIIIMNTLRVSFWSEL